MHLTADLDDYLPDFQLAFEGNAEATFGTYYHTDSTRQLNERFGDLKMKIQDLEVVSMSQTSLPSPCTSPLLPPQGNFMPSYFVIAGVSSMAFAGQQDQAGTHS